LSILVISNSRNLLNFLFTQGGLLKSTIIPMVVASSVSRAVLIFAINETAARRVFDGALFALLLASIGATLFTFHRVRVKNHQLVERLQLKMRQRMAQLLMNADVSLMQRRDHGKIFAALTQEVNRVANSATKVVAMIQALVLLAICLIYLAWLSWPSAIATLFAIAVGGVGFIFAERAARPLVEEANQAAAGFYDRVNDMLHGYKELRLRTSRRADLGSHIAEIIEVVRARSVEAERLFSLGENITQGAVILLLSGIVLSLPLIIGTDTVTVLQILTVLLFSYGPIETMVSGLPAFARAAISKRLIDTIETDLASNAEPAQIDAAKPQRTTFGTLTLQGLTAKLKRNTLASDPGELDTFTLGPIDLVFKPGTSVFITGGNGTGKSTLLLLLSGLRHPDGGKILIDNVPVTLETIADYRSLFSAVFSEFHLFQKLYGLSAMERLELEEKLLELGLEDIVSILGDEFSSLALSTGQMRRLALALALAERKPIIILDEFAADQDPVRRKYFYDILVPRLTREGHLVIAVTHDEHCFSKCDRLISMDGGKIVSDTGQPAQSHLNKPKNDAKS
jgi:putative ATP-binding cassette transporter